MSSTVNLKSTVYATLKQKILSNEFKPGDYLEEKRLCEMLGVSRTPIREAINLLQRDDFVQAIPNKGIFVSNISLQSIKELFQVRHLLEPITLRLSLPHLDIDQVISFRSVFETGLTQKDYPLLHQTDYDFHNYITHQCGNSYLIRIMDNISDHFQRVRTQEFFTESRTENGAREHIALIELMIKNDVQGASVLLEKHISSTENFFFKSLI